MTDVLVEVTLDCTGVVDTEMLLTTDVVPGAALKLEVTGSVAVLCKYMFVMVLVSEKAAVELVAEDPPYNLE